VKRLLAGKLISQPAIRAFDDHELSLYGDGLDARDWIHVEDVEDSAG